MNDPGVLIEPAQLAAKMNHSPGEWVCFDCRSDLFDPEAGHRQYLQEHLPTAQWLSLEDDLSAPVVTGTGRHPLPDRATLLSRFGQLGVSPEAHVVAYDGANGSFAARCWWLLRWLGHKNVQILNGGSQAWAAARLPLEQGTGHAAPARTALPDRSPLVRVTTATNILDRLQGPATQASTASAPALLDARDAARFRGTVEPVDHRAGHIPGAHSAPFTVNVDQDGRFHDPATILANLRAINARVGEPEQTHVAYCGSGVTACHLIAAFAIAGLPEPDLYPGSFSEWIQDSSRPVAIGG